MDTKELTIERGSEYGHPLHHFDASEQMREVFDEHFEAHCPPRAVSLAERRAIKHAAKFICDKLIRACTSPRKSDHWDGIAGYARTAKMALGLIPGEEPPTDTNSNLNPND